MKDICSGSDTGTSQKGWLVAGAALLLSMFDDNMITDAGDNDQVP